MFCQNCGTQIPDGSKFCGSCGARVGGSQPVQQINQPIPQGGRPIPPVQQGGQPMRQMQYQGQSGQPYMQPGQMNYQQPGQMKTKGKGLPTALVICLAIILFFAIAITVIVMIIAQKNGPLHGAKVKKQVVWETGDLTVTAMKLMHDENSSENPYYILLEADNKGPVDRTVTCYAAAINDIRVDTNLELSVPAGGKSQGELRITDWKIGHLTAFEYFYSISFVLREGDELSDMIRLNTGLKEKTVYIEEGEDTPIYEGEGVLINYASNYPAFSEYGPAVEFYFENNTDKIICFRSGDVSVRGVAIDGKEFDEKFLPHTRGYAYFVLERAQLEKEDLLPLREIITSFECYDPVAGSTIFSTPVNVEYP